MKCSKPLSWWKLSGEYQQQLTECWPRASRCPKHVTYIIVCNPHCKPVKQALIIIFLLLHRRKGRLCEVKGLAYSSAHRKLYGAWDSTLPTRLKNHWILKSLPPTPSAEGIGIKSSALISSSCHSFEAGEGAEGSGNVQEKLCFPWCFHKINETLTLKKNH